MIQSGALKTFVKKHNRQIYGKYRFFLEEILKQIIEGHIQLDPTRKRLDGAWIERAENLKRKLNRGSAVQNGRGKP